MNGAGVPNMMYWDGEKLHVIECKGGTSQLGATLTTEGQVDENKMSSWQTTRAYLNQKVMEMRKERPTIEEVGKLLERHLLYGSVQSHVATFERNSPKKWAEITPSAENADLSREASIELDGIASSHALQPEEFDYPTFPRIRNKKGKLIHDPANRPKWAKEVTQIPMPELELAA